MAKYDSEANYRQRVRRALALGLTPPKRQKRFTAPVPDPEAERKEREALLRLKEEREARHRRSVEHQREYNRMWRRKHRGYKGGPQDPAGKFVAGVVARIAHEDGIAQDAVMERFLETGAVDFLIRGFRGCHKAKCPIGVGLMRAGVHAVRFFLDREGASLI